MINSCKPFRDEEAEGTVQEEIIPSSLSQFHPRVWPVEAFQAHTVNFLQTAPPVIHNAMDTRKLKNSK